MNTLFKNTDYEKIAKILAEVALKNDIEKPDAPSFINNSQKAEFEACVETWKTINKMQEIQQFDTDNAWNKLHQRISDKELFQPINQSKKVISIKQWMSIAAGIVLLIGFTSLWFWQHQSNQTIVVVNNLTEPQKVELPDGSNVFLNKDAQISYNHSYNHDQRNIKLNGEAFFEVVPNPQRPFIVECNQTNVKVLGTSFNVNVSTSYTEVIVKTGRVEFYKNSATESNVILLPGEKGCFIDGALSKTNNEKMNFLSWKDRKLVFKAMPLSQVISDINHTFHCKIEIGDTSINNLLITTTFNNIPLSGIMESITLAFDLKLVKQTENNYLLLK
ncbi:MAG: FecR domain-containing protein [Salinivirgaceae bacterium]